MKIDMKEVKRVANEKGFNVEDKVYVNIKTKMTFVCKSCGDIYNGTFENFKIKQDCKCKKITTPPTLINRLKKLNLTALDDIKHISSKDKLTLKDSEGYLYYLNNDSLMVCIRRSGALAKFFNGNIYTFQNINNYFKINDLNIELLTKDVKNAISKLEFKCLNHNNVFTRSWNSVLNGSIGCSECNGIEKYDLNKVKEIAKEFDCEFLSKEYIGVHEEYLFKCSCGKEFHRRFDVFLYDERHVCPKCNGVNVYTNKDIKEELKANNIELLSEYKNVKENIKVKYSCGFTTERTITSIRGSEYSCPHCNKKGYKRDTKQFYKEIFDLVGEEYTFEGEYSICDNKMNVTHNLCGTKYSISPHKFINGGRRCPICNASKSEAEINKYLTDNNYTFKREYTFDYLLGLGGMPLRFDFALFIKNGLLLIEYDGEYHYKPIESEEKLKIQQEHDRRKNEYCNTNNIELLRIPYWKKENMIQIIENKIKEYKED